MPQTYIAAYDGSAASRAAVALAVELAAPHDDRVIAVHVYPRLPPAGLRGGVFDDGLQADLREEGRVKLDGLDIDGVDRRLVAGAPAQALHGVAVEEDAALVVVGATHHRLIGRVTPGSVAANLLHGAPCPVLVVPADRATDPIRTIVVAYDDGPQAQAALRRGEELARAAGARLRIVAAYEPKVFAGPAMVAASDLEQIMSGDLRERVHEAADAIDGIEVEVIVQAGGASDVVCHAAKDADLIVTGSRGYGPLHSVLVGGVSRQLADRAPCPVLVVPRVAEVAEDQVPAPDGAPQPA